MVVTSIFGWLNEELIIFHRSQSLLSASEADSSDFHLYGHTGVHLPQSPTLQRWVHASNSVTGEPINNEHRPTGVWTPMPDTTDTTAMATSLHCFRPIDSSQPQEPVENPATFTCHSQGGPKEPTLQDWNMLRPIVIILSSNHSLVEVCKIVREKHGFKIR